jgi:hypothetical protein
MHLILKKLLIGINLMIITSSLSSESTIIEPPCRDRFYWPFNSSSIWNTAIGSSAVFLPANIYSGSGDFGLPVEIHNDQEWIIRTTYTDPIVQWIDDSNNFPGMCTATGKFAPEMIPIPANFTTDCVANNNAAGVLLPDNVTLIQMQPLYRPKGGNEPIIAWYHTGAPQPFPWNLSILDDGNLGAHGGSGLSSIGGSIRSGELQPNAPPITHALKLELDAHLYYYWDKVHESSCYTWPAIGCDTMYNSFIGYNGTNPYLKPGALLAVPATLAPDVFANLTTIPGKRILSALVDFGGYIVDDTGSKQGGGAICMEHAVNEEVLSTYGYSIAIENPLVPTQGGELYFDIVTIFKALQIVTNNSPTTIGGGGIPRQPPPPPFCDM